MSFKRKINKQYLLTPDENEWSRDTNKLGFKLLKTMGWTPGKGLGAQEQGMAKPIIASTKYVDGRGLGLSDIKPMLVVEQYDNILKSLNGVKEDGNLFSSQHDKKCEPLSKKRKQAKSEYHWRSIKAKDTSLYTTSDMKGVFGFVDRKESN